MGKAYRGFRGITTSSSGKPEEDTCRVWVIGNDGKERPLNPHLDMVNHSPTGMEWGYCGSGPAQLAFALAYDVTRDRRRAEHVHQRLKFRVVGRLPHIAWTLTADEVLAAIVAIEDAEPVGELGDQGDEEQGD